MYEMVFGLVWGLVSQLVPYTFDQFALSKILLKMVFQSRSTFIAHYHITFYIESIVTIFSILVFDLTIIFLGDFDHLEAMFKI